METATAKRAVRPLPSTPPISPVSPAEPLIRPSKPSPRPLPSPPGSSSSISSVTSTKSNNRNTPYKKSPDSPNPSQPIGLPSRPKAGIPGDTIPTPPKNLWRAEKQNASLWYAADAKGKGRKVEEPVTCLMVGIVAGDDKLKGDSDKTESSSKDHNTRHTPPSSQPCQSKAWVCEKRGQRWEEHDYQVILRALRSL